MKVEQFLLDATFKGNKNAYFVLTAGQAIGNAGNYCKKICAKGEKIRQLLFTFVS